MASMVDNVKNNVENTNDEIDFTDEIESITSSANDVYDIEVEDIHLFNSNGFISDNSETIF